MCEHLSLKINTLITHLSLYDSLVIHYKCLCYCSTMTFLERETEQCITPFRGLLNYPVSS